MAIKHQKVLKVYKITLSALWIILVPFPELYIINIQGISAWQKPTSWEYFLLVVYYSIVCLSQSPGYVKRLKRQRLIGLSVAGFNHAMKTRASSKGLDARLTKTQD